MKKLLIIGLMLVGSSAYAQLSTASGGRLTDYTNWFSEFGVASDGFYLGEPYPKGGTPAPFTDAYREWTGWVANTGLTAPITGSDTINSVEVVFLGETAGWWDDFGYRMNNVNYLLADGVQTIGPGKNRAFGDHRYFSLGLGETLDFFVTGSGGPGQDGLITVGPDGGLYYALGSPTQSYIGTIVPEVGSSVRNTLTDNFEVPQWTVVAFEDIAGGGDQDYNDFIFAFRAGKDIPQGPVPEPSTYGLIAAAALLGLVGYRRFKKV